SPISSCAGGSISVSEAGTIMQLVALSVPLERLDEHLTVRSNPESDGSVAGRSQDFCCRAVLPLQPVLDGLVATTGDDKIGRAPASQILRVGAQTAVVRRQQDIDGQPFGPQEFDQTLSFQVSRQQDLATRVLNAQDHAVGIV